MLFSQFKQALTQVDELFFVQPDGNLVPLHFHITEVGLTTKHFIDCGGTVRTEKNINFQLWVAGDTEHRLKADKLLKIIQIAEPLLGEEDLEVEAEYQAETIGRYGLEFDGARFVLQPKFTDCLAQDACGIPPAKKKLSLSSLTPSPVVCCSTSESCC